jgi:dTDP-6-deoxy-L-talose 4-dehydrogenase (NAD+)
MTRRVLVTGAAGFVGRQVVRALSEKGMELRLMTRAAKMVGTDLLLNDCEIVTSEDLFAESPQWWAEQCEGVDTVVHLAWYAEPGKYLQSSKNMDCLVGSLDLARGAVQAGVKRLIGVGTCFEYDLSGGVLSVDTPLKPITPYAGAKAALYLSLDHWLQIHSVEFAWCRLFYLYGEGEDPRRLVPYLRSRLEKGGSAELTSGEQIRDFLDVADAGRMIADVVLSDQTGPVNICSGVAITVRQLAEQIADEYGRRELLAFGARPDNLIDPPCVVGIPNIQAKRLIS